MELKKRLELIKRNTIEVIREDELIDLLKKTKRPITYCGYEVSGEVHLGHLVTIIKLLDLEKAGFKIKILLADYHTFLNKKGSWDEIKKSAEIWEKIFKEAGLKSAEYVLGSSFQKDPKYFEDILKMSLGTTLSRALRSMQEVARDIENAKVSQIIYPLMQIQDIKALKIDVATSGLEQRKIHMLAREILPSLDYKSPILVHTPLISSLKGPGSKMSSSDPVSLISLRDSKEEIVRKINKAYCPEGVVEENPILQITKLIIFPTCNKIIIEALPKFGGNKEFNSYEKLEEDYKNKKIHPLDLKNAVSKRLVDILEKIWTHP